MAAHRYWRLRFDSAVGGTTTSYYIWLQEVSFRDANDSDLSVGGVATASSKWISTAGDPNDYKPELAFDKQMTGLGWCSAQGQFPCWLAYDHMVPVSVDTVLVRVHASANTSMYPVDKYIYVEYSDNGTTWTAQKTFVGGSFSGSGDTRLGTGTGDTIKLVSIPPRTLPGYNLEPQSPRRRLLAKGATSKWETQTTGAGRISGKVTIENIPGSRKVRLYRKHDGMLLRETWSRTDGFYEFINLDPIWEYFVLAHDHLRVHNAVIQDMIDPP